MSDDLSGFSLMDLFRVEAESQTAILSSGLLELESNAGASASSPETIEPMMRAAHSLKSTAESLGATGLAALARELETAARAGSLDGAASRLDRLTEHYERAASALEDLRRDLTA